jgi:hypothetical protein
MPNQIDIPLDMIETARLVPHLRPLLLRLPVLSPILCKRWDTDRLRRLVLYEIVEGPNDGPLPVSIAKI